METTYYSIEYAGGEVTGVMRRLRDPGVRQTLEYFDRRTGGWVERADLIDYLMGSMTATATEVEEAEALELTAELRASFQSQG
jgi:hypothetical protein